jgi:hypothetical protein
MSIYFRPIPAQISYNVLAVTDVFAIAIKEHEVFQQPQKCGGEKTHKGRSPTGVFRSPSRRRRRCSYSPVMCRFALFLIIIYSFFNIYYIKNNSCVVLRQFENIFSQLMKVYKSVLE